jgi:hypothetical protein
MGYVFDQETLLQLVAAEPGRERIFFVTPEPAGYVENPAELYRFLV